MITENENYQPALILTVYEEQTTRKIYVEQSRIQDGVQLASSPLTIEDAVSLGEQLYQSTSKQISGFLPEKLKHIGWENNKPVLTWTTDAQRVQVHYEEDLCIPDGFINVPPLVWKWNEYSQELKMFANGKRPHELRFAPFHNIDEDGYVCLGTGLRFITKCETFEQTMRMVEKVFWGSSFSAIHNANAVKGNLNALHTELVQTGCKFPTEKLNNANITFKEFVNED